MDDSIRVAVIGELESAPPGYQLVPADGVTACDLVHVCGPSPLTLAALDWGAPVVVSYHPLLDADFYRHCRVVISPAAAADAALVGAGVPLSVIIRRESGVDLSIYSPAQYDPSVLPMDRFNVLWIGEALDAFELARDRDSRLWLTTGPLTPSVYATADLLVFADIGDPFGEPILRAQASGLPVLALERCAAAALIEDGRSGCLVGGELIALADAVRGLARRTTLLERLATGGLPAARERPIERSLCQLAEAWSVALEREVLRAA